MIDGKNPENPEEPSMALEKRRFSRIVFDVRAELTVGDQTFEPGHMDDLSIGGCLLPITATRVLGSPCRVTIFLSGVNSEPVIRVQGKIVRADSGQVAIKFTAIDPDSLVHLHNIVLHNSPDADKTEEEIRHHPGLF
jgi:PilZ domain